MSFALRFPWWWKAKKLDKAAQLRNATEVERKKCCSSFLKVLNGLVRKYKITWTEHENPKDTNTVNPEYSLYCLYWSWLWPNNHNQKVLQLKLAHWDSSPNIISWDTKPFFFSVKKKNKYGEDFNTAEFEVLQGCQSATGYGDVAEPSLMAEGVGHGVTMTPAYWKRIKHFWTIFSRDQQKLRW